MPLAVGRLPSHPPPMMASPPQGSQRVVQQDLGRPVGSRVPSRIVGLDREREDVAQVVAERVQDRARHEQAVSRADDHPVGQAVGESDAGREVVPVRLDHRAGVAHLVGREEPAGEIVVAQQLVEVVGQVPVARKDDLVEFGNEAAHLVVHVPWHPVDFPARPEVHGQPRRHLPVVVEERAHRNLPPVGPVDALPDVDVVEPAQEHVGNRAAPVLAPQGVAAARAESAEAIVAPGVVDAGPFVDHVVLVESVLQGVIALDVGELDAPLRVIDIRDVRLIRC